MKTQVTILGVMITAVISWGAQADDSIRKPLTRIDFNKMIDESNTDKEQLHNQIPSAPEEDSTAAAVKKNDKAKVMDFVDVEIGVGEDRPVVDRRFNSVGEAKVVDIEKLQQAQEESEPKPGS
jgi:hypothetical protein